MLLHKRAKLEIERFLARPTSSLLILGPPGVGKGTVSRYIAARVLQVKENSLESLTSVRFITASTGKTISISDVREITQFLRTKAQTHSEISRVVILDNADQLTVQAQNALLKTLEEPPLDALLILAAASDRVLLPTIVSRTQRITLPPPEMTDLRDYFEHDGYPREAVDHAIRISGGLPGLMHALLTSDSTHPLFAATQLARELLQLKLFDRLVLVDELSKQRAQWSDTLFILGQMAHTALAAGCTADAARKWSSINEAVYEAQQQTAANGQLKLVVLNFMLRV